MRTLNDSIKAVVALRPIVVSGEAAAVRGPVIDRKDYEAAIIAVTSGTPGGAPTRAGVDYKVQHCATATGSFADLTGATTQVSGDAAYLVTGLSHIDVNLVAAERYIQLVATPSFFEGSGPTMLIGAVCVLGEARVLPAA